MLHICIISSSRGHLRRADALTRHVRVVLLLYIFSKAECLPLLRSSIELIYIYIYIRSCWTTQVNQSFSPFQVVCIQTKQRVSGSPCVQPSLSTDGGSIMITVTCFSRLWVNSWANYFRIFLLSMV